MNVKQKLITIVVIALLGVLLVGGIGIRNADEDAGVFREIDGVRIPKIEQLGELLVAMTDLVRRSYEILAAGDLPFNEQESELKRTHDQLTIVLKKAPDLIQKFGSLPISKEGLPVWEHFLSLWGPWVENDLMFFSELDKALAAPSQETFNALHALVRKSNMARRKQTTEIREALEKLVEINGRLSSQATEATLASSIQAMWVQVIVSLIVLLMLIFFARSALIAIIKPLNQFRDVLAHVSNEHDLTQRMNYDAPDEIGEMSIAFDNTMTSLQSAFRDIQGQIESVAQSVEALTSTAKEVATSSQSQSSSASAMAASVEEMAVSINTVSASAVDTQAMAQDAGTMSDEGGKIVDQTSSEMTVIAHSVSEASHVIQALGEASKEITNVVQVIREVADQTNLLALNAAIEAARAGEQGRGFAVVADEVRKLAERTAQSTGDISTMIAKIQASAGNAVEKMEKVVKQVESGRSLAEEAGQRIRAIREETVKVSSAMADVSNALKEQGQASNDIAKHVETIAQITDENNAAAEETSNNAQHLDELAKNVQNTINQFKV